MEVDSAVPCGMILNELISNALKHAFPNGRKGELRIGLKRRESGIVEIRVEDNGIGLPEGLDYRRPGTFGLQVVNLLAGQLEAKFEHERGTRHGVYGFILQQENRVNPLGDGPRQVVEKKHLNPVFCVFFGLKTAFLAPKTRFRLSPT